MLGLKSFQTIIVVLGILSWVRGLSCHRQRVQKYTNDINLLTAFDEERDSGCKHCKAYFAANIVSLTFPALGHGEAAVVGVNKKKRGQELLLGNNSSRLHDTNEMKSRCSCCLSGRSRPLLCVTIALLAGASTMWPIRKGPCIQWRPEYVGRKHKKTTPMLYTPHGQNAPFFLLHMLMATTTAVPYCLLYSANVYFIKNGLGLYCNCSRLFAAKCLFQNSSIAQGIAIHRA